jgi:hypothetical protein
MATLVVRFERVETPRWLRPLVSFFSAIFAAVQRKVLLWAIARLQADYDANLAEIQRDFRSKNAMARKRIEEAIQNSERDVLKTGKCMTLVLEDARAQALEARKSLERVDEDSDLAKAIAAQTEAMEAFLAELMTELSAQHKLSVDAANQTNEILRVGEGIAGIARAAKLLNVNAQIEAARLGTHGEAFGVIASEMTTLTLNIEKANRQIGALAASMRERMPRLTSMSEFMVKRSESFFGEFEERQQKVVASEKALQSATLHTLQASETRASATLVTAQDALSALQFQDPMAQSLRKIEALLDDFYERLRMTRMYFALDAMDHVEELGADPHAIGSYYAENRLKIRADLAAYTARQEILEKRTSGGRSANTRSSVATSPTKGEKAANHAPTKLGESPAKNESPSRDEPMLLAQAPPAGDLLMFEDSPPAGDLLMFEETTEPAANDKPGEEEEIEAAASGDVMLF